MLFLFIWFSKISKKLISFHFSVRYLHKPDLQSEFITKFALLIINYTFCHENSIT